MRCQFNPLISFNDAKFVLYKVLIDISAAKDDTCRCLIQRLVYSAYGDLFQVYIINPERFSI